MSSIKKTTLAGFCALFVTGGLVNSALADTIYIDFTKLAAGTVVTDQYPDVTFSLSGGNASGLPTIASGAGLTNTPTSGIYPTAEYLVASFATPVTGVSFNFNNEGFNGGNKYKLEDASGDVLASGLLSGFTYNLSSYADVSTIVWDNGYSTGERNWWQALSTLSYTTAVPEPASVALLGLGMIGTGVVARRRRSTTTPAAHS